MEMEEHALNVPYSHPMLSALSSGQAKKGKIVSATEAARIIRDENTVATSRFMGIGFAEEIAIELENEYLNIGKPRELTLVYAAGQGDGVERSNSR